MSDNKEFGGAEPRGISRRTVAIGAAWAVPVIALATASPAYAASGDLILTPGTAGKSPGESCKAFKKGYAFPFTAQNTRQQTIWITGLAISTTPGPPDVPVFTPAAFPTLPISIAAGATETVYMLAQSTNSANLAFTAHLTITWGYASDGSQPAPSSPSLFDIVIPGTPPTVPCPD